MCAATQTRSLTDLDAAGFGLEPAGRQGDSSARAELARLRAQVEELRAAAGRAEEQWGKERERFCAAASRAATEEAEAAAERDALKKEVQVRGAYATALARALRLPPALPCSGCDTPWRSYRRNLESDEVCLPSTFA